MTLLRILLRELLDFPITLRRILLAVLICRLSGREIALKSRRFRKLRASDLVAFVPFYGNDAILPAFLDHHRTLGVDLFVWLDLSTEGGLAARLADANDCMVWRPRGRTPKLKRSVLWLNHLRRRFGTGRWCLSLDPSEFVVFNHSETRTLKDLAEFAEGERRDHLFAIVIEMYAERPASEMSLAPGQHPLELLSLFDPLGYETPERGRFYNIVVRGGPQRRKLFQAIPRRAPALSRIPLVKWRWFFSYAAGTRLMLPRKLNQPHAIKHANPTLCLLSFAQLDSDEVLARAAAAEAGELAPGGGDLIYPGTVRLRRLALKIAFSQPYADSADLVDTGLLNPGQWF